MGNYWGSKGFSYVTGAVRFADLAYVSLVCDKAAGQKEEHSHVVEWDDGDWCSEDEMNVEWNTVGVAVAAKPLEQGIILGPGGQIMCNGSGDFHIESVGDDVADRGGVLRGIRTIGERVYAVGMGRQVYRRDQKGKWSAIDKGLAPTDGGVVGFEAIDGFDEKTITAVGWEGEIWRYTGRSWKQLKSPTELILTDVCCAGDGTAYACGQMGTVLRGKDDKWEAIEHGAITDNIWGLCWFNDKLYLSTMDAVYTLEGDKLELVDFGEDVPDTCYHLSAADGVMWSIGGSDIMAFDGKAWARID